MHVKWRLTCIKPTAPFRRYRGNSQQKDVSMSHERSGLDALIHDSETQAVLMRSKIPTLVYR
jgi:hypothetical protein